MIVFLVLIIVVCLGLWWLSPGVVAPFPAPGGISEKVFVMINGVRQGMFIRGKNRLNPVLLFLHGGPAMPEFAISLGYPTELEDDFVGCWWEQRGSGISFAGGPATEEQLVDDGLAVTDYLCARFGQEKIVLLAHSAGTFFGIRLAARAPARFHAYIGVGQITRQMESERLAYAYMIERAVPGTVAKLHAVPLLAMATMPAAYYVIRDKAMHQLGIGTTHAMRSVVTGIFLPVMRCRAYTMREKINLWRGKLAPGTTAMWNVILATDLPALVPGLEIPTYFMSGVFDYTVSGALAKAYLDEIEAPVKGFFWFDESAHSPMFEEPARFGRILRELRLAGEHSAPVECQRGKWTRL